MLLTPIRIRLTVDERRRRAGEPRFGRRAGLARDAHQTKRAQERRPRWPWTLRAELQLGDRRRLRREPIQRDRSEPHRGFIQRARSQRGALLTAQPHPLLVITNDYIRLSIFVVVEHVDLGPAPLAGIALGVEAAAPQHLRLANRVAHQQGRGLPPLAGHAQQTHRRTGRQPDGLKIGALRLRYR